MNNYVLCIANDTENYIMIQKNRPDWQKGKFNYVGGKIENDETPLNSAIREFYEETGVQTDEKTWEYKGVLYRDSGQNQFKIWIYYAKNEIFKNCKTMTDEKIYFKNDYINCLSNIEWLTKMMEDDADKIFRIQYFD